MKSPYIPVAGVQKKKKKKRMGNLIKYIVCDTVLPRIQFEKK
jgi:hypothetical protein